MRRDSEKLWNTPKRQLPLVPTGSLHLWLIPEVAKTRQTFGQTLAFFSQLGATPTRTFLADSQREKVPPPHTTLQRQFATFKRTDNCKSRARARKVITLSKQTLYLPKLWKKLLVRQSKSDLLVTGQIFSLRFENSRFFFQTVIVKK